MLRLGQIMSTEFLMLVVSMGLNIGSLGAIFAWSNRMEHRLTSLETKLEMLLEVKIFNRKGLT